MLKCWYCQKKPRMPEELMCKPCGKLKKRKIYTMVHGAPTVGINRKPA